MKEANNNEVDLLLRALAGRRGTVPLPGGTASAGVQQVASDHLDADELNSYAEGVAPEAARARYTRHLADCDTCRGLVVSLTQASGAVARYEVPELPRGLTFWQKLSALFSQPVWRYAVPAMILTTVIGIGLLALRQRPNDFVAQNESPSNAQPADRSGAGSVVAPTTGSATEANNTPTSATPTAEVRKERGSLEADKTKPSGHEESATGTNVPKEAPAKDSAVAGGLITATESEPADRIESKAAAPAAPPPLAGYDKSAELAKAEPSKREDQDRARNEEFRVQKDDIHGPNRSRSNTTAAPASAQRSPVNGRGGPSNQMNKQANESEVRTVMGRHFTREDGAWVDTDYESQAMIRVRRGSDQYRALVADEPGIRTIAEQLDGVVIVVWKGRAYRIQ